MYVRPAKTQVSLCIDPLYKASFLDSPESEEGAYCTISEGSDQNVTLVIPVWTARLSKLNTISECSDQNMQLRRLTRVFAPRTRRFVKPRDCRRYIRLTKALIRLPMCRHSVQADSSLRTSFIVGFAMHRPKRDLFVQTITLNFWVKFSTDILKYFSILPRKQDLHFMQIVSTV